MDSTPQQQQRKSIFTIPPLIKSLFDTFPLVTYPPYPVPARCPKPSTRPRLYVWVSPEEARRPGGGMSFDPECLKWQTYFRFCGIQYKTVPSNNHACPSNSSSLPFLIPPAPPPSPSTSTSSDQSPPQHTPPIPVPKLAQWARDHGQRKRSTVEGEEDEIDFERGDVQAFMELLENEIRDALIYTTHLHPPNLHNYTTPLHHPTLASNSLLHPILSSQLLAAAQTQLSRRHPGTLNKETIFSNATAALDALSKLLGNDEWFFGGKLPGLLDAAVFAYLHVILKGEWEEDWVGGLRAGVRRRRNLVGFWERVVVWWEVGWQR